MLGLCFWQRSKLLTVPIAILDASSALILSASTISADETGLGMLEVEVGVERGDEKTTWVKSSTPAGGKASQIMVDEYE